MGKMFFCSRQAFLPLVSAICSMLLVSGCSPSAQSKRQSSIIGQDKALAQAQEAYKTGDLRSAMRIWRQLSDKGNATAKFNIGLMYSSEIAFQKNDAVAAKWYKEAADEGLAQAQNNLATMYTSGKGVPQDYVAAFKWFRKSADQGYAQAQLYLGIRYFLGLGVPQNYIEAHKWCNLSAAGASDPEVQTAAAECRSKVASNMPADKVAEAQRLASAWKPLKGTNISAYAEMALKVTRYRERIAKGDAEFFGPPTKTNKVFASPRAPAPPEEMTQEEYEASLPPGYSREDHEFFGPIYLPPVPPQT